MNLAPCPCGKPWPMTVNPTVEKMIELQIAQLGELVVVNCGNRSWWVPRRCIAYHGITGSQLLSGKSGFTEILNGSGQGRHSY